MYPTELDLQATRQVIEAQYPGLQLESLAVLGDEGQFSRLLLINGELVFRSPRYRNGILTLGREAQILKHIWGRVPLRTPYIRWVSPPSAEFGETFLAYDILPGRPLWSEVLETEVDAAVRLKLAYQLGGFLAELQGIELWDEATKWPILDGAEVLTQMYGEVREHLFSAMRRDARQAVDMHFAECLHDTALREFTPCLRHGDFGSGNVLYDPVEQTVSGILDFSKAGVGDPVIDLVAATCFGDRVT